GTEIVVGATGGLPVVRNDGTVATQLPVVGITSCTPIRWWAVGVVLASCVLTDGSDRLWEVPMSGAATTLTGPPVPPDTGDLNAWQVGTDVYLQDAGGCGSAYLAKLEPNSS